MHLDYVIEKNQKLIRCVPLDCTNVHPEQMIHTASSMYIACVVSARVITVWHVKYAAHMYITLNQLDYQALQLSETAMPKLAVCARLVCVGCILDAWQQGDRMQRSKLLDQLVRVLQSVSEEEAQALPDKDPERRSLYDRVCTLMVCCA